MSELGNMSENFKELERQRKERISRATDLLLQDKFCPNLIIELGDQTTIRQEGEKNLLLQTIQGLAGTIDLQQKQQILTTQKICQLETELNLIREHNQIQDNFICQIDTLYEEIKKIKGKLLEGAL